MVLGRSVNQGDVASELALAEPTKDEIHPNASTTDRFGVVLVLLAVVLGAATLAIFFVPGFYFAVPAPEADTFVNTAGTVGAAAVAAFAWIRYRDSHRIDALLQSSAFLTLAVAGGFRTALQATGQGVYEGFSVDHPGQAPIYAWTFARLVAGSLLLTGAISTLNRWRSPGWRAGGMLLLGPLVTVGYSILVLLLEPSLPVILPAQTLQALVARGTVLDASITSPPLVIIELIISFVFVVSAIAYARVWRRGERDGYTALLAVSLLFAAFTQVHFAFAPSAYADIVTSGDMLRLGFYLLVFAAVGTAIRDDLRSLRRANVDLERLRRADAERISAEERARLAREVHDGLVQDLWLARLTSGRVAEIARLPHDAREMLRRLDATLESAQGEARQALITLQARSDVPFGELLKRFVDDYADRFDIDIERDIDAQAAPPPDIQTELLRLCREALNNVRKHADASRVRVIFKRSDDLIRLVISDNGKGFDRATLNGRGFGMESMRQRAAKVGGRLDVRSEPMGGTTVELELPVTAPTA